MVTHLNSGNKVSYSRPNGNKGTSNDNLHLGNDQELRKNQDEPQSPVAGNPLGSLSSEPSLRESREKVIKHLDDLQIMLDELQIEYPFIRQFVPQVKDLKLNARLARDTSLLLDPLKILSDSLNRKISRFSDPTTPEKFDSVKETIQALQKLVTPQASVKDELLVLPAYSNSNASPQRAASTAPSLPNKQEQVGINMGAEDSMPLNEQQKASLDKLRDCASRLITVFEKNKYIGPVIDTYIEELSAYVTRCTQCQDVSSYQILLRQLHIFLLPVGTNPTTDNFLIAKIEERTKSLEAPSTRCGDFFSFNCNALSLQIPKEASSVLHKETLAESSHSKTKEASPLNLAKLRERGLSEEEIEAIRQGIDSAIKLDTSADKATSGWGHGGGLLGSFTSYNRQRGMYDTRGDLDSQPGVNSLHGVIFKSVVANLRETFPNAKSIEGLDVGCGENKFGTELSSECNAAGIPLNMRGTNIRQLMGKYRRLEYDFEKIDIQAAETLLYPDNSFHLVVSTYAATRYTRRLDIVLDELFRVTIPGGECHFQGLPDLPSEKIQQILDDFAARHNVKLERKGQGAKEVKDRAYFFVKPE